MDAPIIKNIKQWMATCPNEGRLLLNHACNQVFLCKTDKGEWNLKREFNGKTEYFHSQKGAMEEAREWFRGIDLYGIQTLFVYGVGAGYGYLAAKEWLKENEKRMLIFLDDDLEVIHRLFETEIGGELIFDEQVRLQYFQKLELEGEEAEQVVSGIYAIPLQHFMSEMQISVLKYYREKYAHYYPIFVKQLEFIKNLKAVQILEYMNFGDEFFENFYRNLYRLPSSYWADRSFGEFEGIPAIICGAGPSLEKNLSVLEKLADRAVIIAGGSSLNVVNVNGFLPHFGISIDPNWNQYARLFMNQSYEVPFFYRNRIYPGAFSSIHGNHLYVKGSGGHGIANWFEEKLGLKGEEIPEGNNVVNFGLSIAHALGCNPIILVGVDLAYTDYRSYAKGILPHPILDVNREIQTKAINEDLILRTDVNGQPVHTLWKWMRESIWMTQFAVSNPALRVINATEGGMGFNGIPNMTLEAASQHFLTKQFDMKAFLHAEIQKSEMPPEVSTENITGLMQKMISSLEKCGDLCSQLRKEFNTVLKQINETKQVPANLVTERALELLKELNQEEAYQAVLKSFNEAFVKYVGADVTQIGISMEADPHQLHARRLQFNKRRYEFLKAVSRRNIELLKESIEVERVRSQITGAFTSTTAEDKKKSEEALRNLRECLYEVDGNRFRIKDGDLDLSFDENLISSPTSQGQEPLHGHSIVNYPSGAKKMELYYKEGFLHGPSTSYSEKGVLLSQSWYIQGNQEGKALFYYSDGELHSIESYKEGQREGEQHYFYPDGSQKSKIPYRQGKIHGAVELYYPSGLLKREIQFQHGKRDGTEKSWNLGGIQELEVTYKEDKPVGTARNWYGLGQPAREIVYDENGAVVDIKGWNPNGSEIPGEYLNRKDYFNIVEKQTEDLTHTLETVFKEVEEITRNVSSTSTSEYDPANDLKELKEEMDKLKKINVDMGNNKVSSETSESLWKTPETRKMLGKQMQEAAELMTEDVKAIEEILKMTVDLWKNKRPKRDFKEKKDNEPPKS